MESDPSQNTVPDNPADKRPPEQGMIGEQITPQSSGLLEIANLIIDRAEPFIKIVESVAEKSLTSKKADARFRIQMAWVAVAIVTLIVVAASVLTFQEKLDGSTYGFLLGLIVGYVLTFIRDAIKPDGKE